ncbi:MAG: DUF4065 domain-containing protein [bacterium]|nr:DUF4065 domain-containing protein [bacterium]
METITDVANWFLAKESMTHKKLQKLCYYAQAWHCALLDEPLFADEVQAWVHGPVIPALYKLYSDFGWKQIPQYTGELPKFNEKTLEILETVVNTYMKFTGDVLERITHAEKPWQEARGNLEPWETCTAPISTVSMATFYKQLYQEAQGE